MKRLGVLHTAPFLVDVFKKRLGERYPGLESFHVVEESLIQDARRHGGLVLGIVRRIATQLALAQEAGAEVILFTCSSTSPAVDAVRPPDLSTPSTSSCLPRPRWLTSHPNWPPRCRFRCSTALPCASKDWQRMWRGNWPAQPPREALAFRQCSSIKSEPSRHA